MRQASAASTSKHLLVEKAFGPGLGLVLALIVGSAVYFGDHRPSELQRRMQTESTALLGASGIKVDANVCVFMDKQSASYQCPIPVASLPLIEQNLQAAGWRLARRTGNRSTYELGRKSVHIEAATAAGSRAWFQLVFHPR